MDSSLGALTSPVMGPGLALSPNGVVFVNLPPFQVDGLIRSVMVTLGGSGGSAERGQVFALLHRYRNANFIGEDYRDYPEIFVGEASENIEVRAGENWQLVCYCGSLTLATQLAFVFADFRPGQKASGPPELNRSEVGSGRGTMRSIALGDPAAGAQYAVLANPGNVMWKWRGGSGSILLSGVAGLRTPQIAIDDGVNINVRAPSAGISVVGSSFTLGSAKDAQPTTVGAAASIQECPAPDVWVKPGWRIQPFRIEGIDAADNLGAGQAAIEEWAGVA